MAHRGTVFLDEIGEMDLNVQAKLLRVLQEREVCRLGDDRIIPVDIRIISATNKNLYELVEQKLFREDLLYRLNVLELNLPPLRSRTGDVPLLVNAYMKRQNRPVTFLPDAMERSSREPCPGNVRQLFNLLERSSHCPTAGKSRLHGLKTSSPSPGRPNRFQAFWKIQWETANRQKLNTL